MSDRRLLIVGNWKMYASFNDSVRIADHIVRQHEPDETERDACEVVVCPSFPALPAVAERAEGSAVLLGAQDIHEEASGPHTGDTSVALVSHFVRYAIVGHSERRQAYGETYERIARKASRALKAGIHPIVCVGETADEREAGNAVDVIRQSVRTVAEQLSSLDVPRAVFAYEPIWAIAPSAGEQAPQPDSHEVAEIAGLIRKTVADASSSKYAEKMRVLYGGSVTAKTVGSFVSEPGVDGALVGGASTKPAEFLSIIKEVEQCRS